MTWEFNDFYWVEALDIIVAVVVLLVFEFKMYCLRRPDQHQRYVGLVGSRAKMREWRAANTLRILISMTLAGSFLLTVQPVLALTLLRTVGRALTLGSMAVGDIRGPWVSGGITFLVTTGWLLVGLLKWRYPPGKSRFTQQQLLQHYQSLQRLPIQPPAGSLRDIRARSTDPQMSERSDSEEGEEVTEEKPAEASAAHAEFEQHQEQQQRAREANRRKQLQAREHERLRRQADAARRAQQKEEELKERRRWDMELRLKVLNRMKDMEKKNNGGTRTQLSNLANSLYSRASHLSDYFTAYRSDPNYSSHARPNQPEGEPEIFCYRLVGDIGIFVFHRFSLRIVWLSRMTPRMHCEGAAQMDDVCQLAPLVC